MIAGEAGGKLMAGSACVSLSCPGTCRVVRALPNPRTILCRFRKGSARVSLVIPTRRAGIVPDYQIEERLCVRSKNFVLLHSLV
jgi:hypothetical protein